MPTPDTCLHPSPHLTPSQREPWLRARLERCSLLAAHRPQLYGSPFRGASICEGSLNHGPRLIFMQFSFGFLSKPKRRQPFELYSSTSQRLSSTNPRSCLVFARVLGRGTVASRLCPDLHKKQHYVHVRRAVTIAIRCPGSAYHPSCSQHVTTFC
jgi:hypothetical protein